MKHALYRWLPSWSRSLHAKRRKGWRRGAEAVHPLKFGQELQDLVLFEDLLARREDGVFWELGAGDGIVGLHSLALELFHGWRGVLVEHEPRLLPWRQARARRQALCLSASPASYPESVKVMAPGLLQPDLVACHSPLWNDAAVTAALAGTLCPRVLVLEVPDPDHRWVRRLRPRYRFAFAFHDDEYYVARDA